MQTTEIFEKVKSIIIDEISIDESKITMEASLKDDLGADSLDAVEIIMVLEEEFNISIPDEEAQKMTHISDIVNYIEANIK